MPFTLLLPVPALLARLGSRYRRGVSDWRSATGLPAHRLIGSRPRSREGHSVSRQYAAGGQTDRLDVRLPARQPASNTAAHADDPHLGHVALQQGIGRLGGGMRDEDDVIRIKVVPREELLEALNRHVFESGIAAPGETIAVAFGAPIPARTPGNTLRLHKVTDS